MRVGILGGGQLGRMLMLAGHSLDIETTAFETSMNVPCAQVGQVTAGDFSDREKLRSWASSVDVITYEWENIPAELVADLAELRPVAPRPLALVSAQDRWREKKLFSELEIPVPPFRLVTDEASLDAAINELDLPLVCKTRTGGYDGKGQVVLREQAHRAEVLDLLRATGEAGLIAEQWVPFDTEVSIIGVRGKNGEVVTYPLVQNEHRNGILHSSTVVEVEKSIQAAADRSIEALLTRLDYVGVLTLELFVVDGRVLANEMAPRVHNSGHWTIEGAETSQFENHLRAVTGLPLGSTAPRGPVAMINLIGQTPSLDELLAVPGAHVHLYGKSPRPGRKLGHVTITAPTQPELHARFEQVDDIVENVLG